MLELGTPEAPCPDQWGAVAPQPTESDETVTPGQLVLSVS